MKNAILFILMFCAVTAGAVPKPIACSIRHDGRLKLWFDYVTTTTGPSGETCLNCHSPGWKRCIPSNAQNFPGMADAIELKAVEDLFEESDLLIEGGQMSGSIEKRIQVQGEAFLRVYECIWSLDSRGNGKVLISRDDV